jgi:hypothetical protein
LKALLVHGARDQCCSDPNALLDTDDPGPDYSFGYGAIDAHTSVDLVRLTRANAVVEAPGFAGSGECVSDPATVCDYDADASADDDEYLVDLPAGLASYRATLAWDDLPNTELLARTAPALVNDLDLFLVAPDAVVHRAWRLDRASPANAATRGANTVDPLEVVDVSAPMAGIWRIVVRPRAIAPGDVAPVAQRYSLVYPRPLPDVMVRDGENDDGGVPSARHERGDWIPGRFWQTPDLFIDGDEVVRPGEQRTLHALVTNAGPTTVSDAVVELFFSQQGVGLDYDDFTAHPIGSCVLPELSPGERSLPADCALAYTWAAQDLVIGDDGSSHVCLLARVTATGDPVTFAGRASIPAGANPAVDYVPWDNNLAQQNLALERANENDGEYDVDVHNPSEAQARPVQVIVNSSELPSGWTAVLQGGPIFSVPAGGRVAARLQIQPPAQAVDGARGTAHVHGIDMTTGALLSGVTMTLTDSDRDGDAVRDPGGGVPGPLDNCPAEANAGQADVDANGRGDACECGDTDDDGRVLQADITRLRLHLAGISPPLSAAGLAKCSVIGPAASCDVLDSVVLRRALRPVPLAPGIAQTCAAAGV